MKIFALLLAIFAVVQAKPAFVTPTSHALQVRGGASIGPFDKAMGDNVGNTIVACYLGASASKFIAGQTGGSAPALADLLTNDVMSLLALLNAIATSKYFLGDTGFDDWTLGIVLTGVAIALKVNDAGGIDKIVDVFMANKVLCLMFLACAYVHFA